MAAQVRDRLADYIPVNERLEQFYAEHEQGRVLTTILEHDIEAGFILMRAEIYRNQEDAAPASTGHAFEYKGEGYVNKTSYIENCETSAVGRALAMLGYEIKRGIASREEMQKVQRHASDKVTPINPPPPEPKGKPVNEAERPALIKSITDAVNLLNSKFGARFHLGGYIHDNYERFALADLSVEDLNQVATYMMNVLRDAERDAQEVK